MRTVRRRILHKCSRVHTGAPAAYAREWPSRAPRACWRPVGRLGGRWPVYAMRHHRRPSYSVLANSAHHPYFPPHTEVSVGLLAVGLPPRIDHFLNERRAASIASAHPFPIEMINLRRLTTL